jgi:hypothetical protein
MPVLFMVTPPEPSVSQPRRSPKQEGGEKIQFNLRDSR